MLEDDDSDDSGDVDNSVAVWLGVCGVDTAPWAVAPSVAVSVVDDATRDSDARRDDDVDVVAAALAGTVGVYTVVGVVAADDGNGDDDDGVGDAAPDARAIGRARVPAVALPMAVETPSLPRAPPPMSDVGSGPPTTVSGLPLAVYGDDAREVPPLPDRRPVDNPAVADSG